MQKINIEVLRSIAITGVIAYHLGIPVNSGYLGVDIFFVISGYLVFSKIQSHPHFDFKAFLDFLKMRFWRIYPALLLTSSLTGFAATFILSPVQELQVTSKATIFTLGFIGNYFFAITTGNYFDDFANSLPNLHFWSISVEFQVWLLFAIILFVVKKFLSKQNTNLFFLIFFVAISLFIAFLENLFMGDLNNSTHSFYSTSVRSVELLVGALVAMFPRVSKNPLRKLNLLVLFSILLMLTWPSQVHIIFNVFIVFLSAMYIWSNPFISLNVFSKPFVFIGSYAYVLYLVHWPIVVILNRAIPFDSTTRIIIELIFIFLSMIPLKLFESFFIKKSRDGFGVEKAFIVRLLIGALICILVIVTPGVVARGGGFDPQVREIYNSKKRSTESCHNFQNSAAFKKCIINFNSDKPLDNFLIGDSHASTYTDSFLNYARFSGSSTFISTFSGCPAFPINRTIDGKLTNCISYSEWILDQIEFYKPHRIFIANRINNYLNSELRVAGEGKEISNICVLGVNMKSYCGEDPLVRSIYKESISDFISKIPVTTSVFVIVGQPEFQSNFEECETLFTLKPNCFVVSLKDHIERNKSALNIYSDMKVINTLDISKIFCGDKFCQAIIDNQVWFHDSHHLNVDGARKVFNRNILPLLELS